MSDRNIVTQVGIEDLKFALAEVAENLDSHVNASLSKAHGLNLVTGYVDGYGNDLTVYQDSNGDSIGDYFLRFTIDSETYYAPANFTFLGGQDETTGSIDTSPDTDVTPEAGAAWVTDYTSDQVPQAEAINSDVLVAHTRSPHWDAHGGLTVLTQDSFSATGHKVGTHVIRMRVGDVIYNIPCSNRLGGPVQIARGVSILTSFYDKYKHPRDINLSVPTNTTGGTLPFTYQWQIFTNDGWTNITPDPDDQDVSDGSENVSIRWTSAESGTMVVVESNPGNGASHTFIFRVIVTNPAGSVTSNNFQYSVTNKSSCFITSAVVQGMGLPDDCYELSALRHFRDAHVIPKHPHAWEEYKEIAPKIVAAIDAQENSKDTWGRIYRRYIIAAVGMVEDYDYEGAYNLYVRMVEDLKGQWLR